jgi:hypothetical protein
MFTPLLLNSVINITLMTGLFAAVDKGITALGLQRPYYAVHVLHNAAMVALTASDVRDSFTRICDIHTLPVNWPAIWLCFALHFYHLWLYWRSLRFDDWLHHGLMIGVALPLGCVIGGAGPLVGFSLFFTTGLPGGIGYAALWLERNGCLRRATEKRIGRWVNVWLRAPGCVAHATLTTAVMLSSAYTMFDWQLVGGLLTAALTGWNGLYFMEQAVASHAALNA